MLKAVIGQPIVTRECGVVEAGSAGQGVCE